MAKYEVLRDTWISHQNIVAKAGTVIDVEFPKVNGKPMQIGDNLVQVRGEGKGAKTDATPGGDGNTGAPGSDLT